MPIALLIPEYFLWHYTTALRLCLNIATNFVWFVYHFFSMPVLFRTLFSPWHKIHEKYRSGFHPSSFAETFVINTIMRMVGFAVRAAVIIFGGGLCIVTVLFGLTLFLIWLALPLAVLVIILLSFRLLLP